MNGKDYGKKEIIVGEGYELVKLGSICESINKKSKLDKEEYNYVEISDIENNMLCNYSCYKKDEIPNKASNTVNYGNILISCVRPKSSKILLIHDNLKNIDNFVFSSGLANIKLKDITKSHYVYYILCILSKNFEKDLCTGSSYPRFSPEILQNLQIPIPTSQYKLQEWVNNISAPYNEKNAKQTQIKELEDFVQHRIREIGENEEWDEVELGSVCDINSKNIVRYNTSYGKEYGKYKFHTGATNSIYYCDECNINEYTIILNKTNGSGKCNIFLDKNISCAKQTYICQSKKSEIETQYIYYYLLNKKDDLQVGYIGACHKNLSCDFLQNFKIKIPKNKQFIQELGSMFQQIETLQNEVKVAEDLYKQLIQELSQEAIPQEKKNIKEPVEKTPPMEEEKMSQKAEPKTKKPKKEKEEKKTEPKTKKPKKEKEEKKAEPIKKKPKFRYIPTPSDEELIDHADPI